MNRYIFIVFICGLMVSVTGCSGRTRQQTETEPHETGDVVQQAAKAEESKYQEPWMLTIGAKPAGPLGETDRKAVRGAFEAFRGAVLRYDGAAASKMMAESSYSYYENVIKTVRIRQNTPEVYEVLKAKISPAVRMMVEIMSRRLTPSFFESATPEKLYRVAFEQGWIGYKSLTTASIDNMMLFKNARGLYYASADFYSDGSVRDKYTARIGFNRENGVWKIDIVPLIVGVEMAINKDIAKNMINVDGSVIDTIEQSESSLKPENWQSFMYRGDNFTAKFPRVPQYGEDGGMRLYTSQHHLYGQFDVRVMSYLPGAADNMYEHPELRKRGMVAFLKGLESDLPSCRDIPVEGMAMTQCDFTIKKHDSRGKAVWFYAPDRMYIVFNIARTDMYDDEAAASFMKHFALIR